MLTFLDAHVFQQGAYVLGACVAEFFEHVKCHLPGLPGCISVASGFLGFSELHEDAGFCPPVPDLAENTLRLPVVTEGIIDAALMIAGFREFLDGVGMLPAIVSLFEISRCFSVQIDGCLGGSEVLMDSTEPEQGHTLSSEVRGQAGGPDITSISP